MAFWNGAVHVQLLGFVCVLLWIKSTGESLDNPGFQSLTGQDDAIFRTAAIAKGNSPTDPPSVCGPTQSESLWVIKCRIYCLQKHNYFLGSLKLPSRQQMSFFSRVLFLLWFLSLERAGLFYHGSSVTVMWCSCCCGEAEIVECTSMFYN